MKANIHPKYREIKVTCSCGHAFSVYSTLEKDALHVDICSNCHPFYTGKQKIVDTGGRVDRFKQRYNKAAQTLEKPQIQPIEAKKTTKKLTEKSAKKLAKKPTKKPPK